MAKEKSPAGEKLPEILNGNFSHAGLFLKEKIKFYSEPIYAYNKLFILYWTVLPEYKLKNIERLNNDKSQIRNPSFQILKRSFLKEIFYYHFENDK
ncbi:MAG TPA: hypothetical protein PKC91_06920 [Ignavibacteria bacterium]|nr:hypothetical protein [Ignavibacteria bacterium]